MAAVSVILPCYRVAPYLPRAIRSLLAQTLSDWEAVIVSDDGEDYQAILKADGITDPRLTFASTGSIGTRAGNARQVGLAHATAPFIAYLDADDAFAPSYLETYLPLVEEHGAVFVKPLYRDDATGQPLPLFTYPAEPTGSVDFTQLAGLLMQPTYISLLHDRARVPVRWSSATSISEDLLFLMQTFEYVDAIYAARGPGYMYYKRDGSTTHSAATMQSFIPSKEALIAAITAGEVFTTRPALAERAAHYFHFSLEAERDYMQSLKTDPDASFVSHFAHRLELAGLLPPMKE